VFLVLLLIHYTTRRALGYFLASGIDATTSPEVIETVNALMDDALINAKFHVASSALTWLLACYREAYPSNHPMIGLQLFLLGDVGGCFLFCESPGTVKLVLSLGEQTSLVRLTYYFRKQHFVSVWMSLPPPSVRFTY
jgi:hypothetical protein